jgi:hypothetical protein
MPYVTYRTLLQNRIKEKVVKENGNRFQKIIFFGKILQIYWRVSKVFNCHDWPKTMLETRCCCHKTVLETYF